jgi:hypothetical protein
MAKRLDMVEKDFTGPSKVRLAVPPGIYAGATLVNRRTHERRDVSAGRRADGSVECEAPEGDWKLMAFYLNREAVLKIRNPGLVDYLDEEAMKVFVSMNYDQFYVRLKPYFGTTITMSFFDEPTLHWLDGRTWTASFASTFEKRFGYSPLKDYPALWYDIGPETASARNALFGWRAQLFADNFVERLARWCKEHGIEGSGHLDQEEAVNPVPINGDLMKVFEHQDVPGADDIFFLGRSNRGYKVVTSASFNYDKPVTMAETYAAYDKLDEQTVLQVAMDQYAMGINRQVPAGDISRRVKNVSELNRYVARLSYLLQHGRHVADVAVLYPIAALQSAYQFAGGGIPDAKKPDTDRSVNELAKAMGPGWEYAYNGGLPPPEIDYMDLGEILFRSLRVDYTYLHPEVLINRCSLRRDRLILDNRENREEFRVLLLPGGDTLSYQAAAKIRKFFEQGGIVVATSRLPEFSAERGHEAELRNDIHAVFGSAAGSRRGGLARRSPTGGRAYFVPKPDSSALRSVLAEALPVRDVSFSEPEWPLKTGRAYDGALTYIHKVKGGRDLYFFANSSRKPVDATVTLRGTKHLDGWNPHSGTRSAVKASETGGVTRFQLKLPPVSSLFCVGQNAESNPSRDLPVR